MWGFQALDSSFRLCQEKFAFAGEVFENRLLFKLFIATFKDSCNAGLMNQDLDQRDRLNFIPLVGIPTHICALFRFPPPAPQHPHRVQSYTVLCQTADLLNPFQFLACSWAEKLTETGDDGQRSARVHSVASNLGSLVLEGD